MPDSAKPAMPTPPVPYHQVCARSPRMIDSFCTASLPTTWSRSASTSTAAATAASGQYVVHSPQPVRPSPSVSRTRQTARLRPWSFGSG